MVKYGPNQLALEIPNVGHIKLHIWCLQNFLIGTFFDPGVFWFINKFLLLILKKWYKVEHTGVKYGPDQLAYEIPNVGHLKLHIWCLQYVYVYVMYIDI